MEAFVKSCPQMLLAKFGANQSNGLGGVGKSKFIFFFFLQSFIGLWGSSNLGFMSIMAIINTDQC